MELALIVEAHADRDLRLRDAAGEQILREADPPVRDVRVRRQADVIAKGAAKTEFVEARVRRELVERDGLRDASVEERAAEEGVRARALADVVGKGLRLPVRSIPPDEAPAYFGWMAALAAEDLRSSSEKTRAALGWEPTGPSLIADLEKFEWV